MGAGASAKEEAKPGDVAAIAAKMDPKDLEGLIKSLDHETSGKLQQALQKGKGVDGACMRRAIWKWDNDTLQEALSEAELEGKAPEGTGLDFLLGKLKFEKDSDKEKADAMMKRVIFMFLQDQVVNQPAYVPPESAKKRCVWLWGEEEVKSALSEIEVKATVPDGKKLLLLEGIDDDAKEKVTDMLGTVGKLFLEDCAQDLKATGEMSK
ncbi:unnamed protein product [Effrenium voratum]|nr:unnamed protein product [Effrenium voratum]